MEKLINRLADYIFLFSELLILRRIIVILVVSLVSFWKVRPMKSLFVSLFAFLTVAVYAVEPPLTSLVPIFPGQDAPQAVEESAPLQIGEWMNAPVPYTVERHTDGVLSLPQPLVPVFPKQYPPPAEEVPPVIRGQGGTMEGVAGILDAQPPVARGPVDAEINPLLTGSTDSPELPEILPANPNQKPAQPGSANSEAKATDPLGYTVLIIAALIMAIGLVCMAFVAYDYRQRWMQSLTLQNDRYIGGGGYDLEMEDAYGGSVPLYEGYGLAHRSI